MKINKIFLMACVALLSMTFVSCGDDDNYSAGPKVGSTVVSFADDANIALELTDTKFNITLTRTDATDELTVPLVVRAASVLSVPSSVTFAAGATTATLEVQISEDSEAFVDYNLDITIPDEYAGSTYLAGQTTYPHLNITVHKEDYKPWGTMSYTSWLFEASWDVDVFYSEYLKLYRAEIFEEGYPFYFTIDDEGVLAVVDGTGAKKQDTVTGSVDDTYGMITCRWLSDNFTGLDGGVYYIPFQYRVSAGSFGANYDSFTLTPAN